MPIITPPSMTLNIPTPPSPPPELAPYVWQAYGTLVQDYLDGRVQNFGAYYIPIAVVAAELELARDAIFRKYHRTRRDMFQAEGRKNLVLMPGYLQRRLLDLNLDEKRELSEATAKIAAKHAETSIDTVYEGARAALKSDDMQYTMHFKVQSASFEVAKAALMAAYANAKQRVVQFNSTLKVIAAQFDLIRSEYKALAQAVEAEIAAVRIEILAAESIGNEEELQRLVAELAVAQKQIDEALSRLPLVDAEIRKAYSEMDILRAEQALATFKELTAQASMAKSEARLTEIARTERKIALDLARVGLQTYKDEVETDSELSTIAARSAEERLSNANSEIQVAKTESDAALTEMRAEINDIETMSAEEKASYFRQRANELVRKFTARGVQRSGEILSKGTREATQISNSTVSRTRNIEQVATNSTTELAASARTISTDAASRSIEAVNNLTTLASAQETVAASKAAVQVAALASELSAKQQELESRVNVAVSQVNGAVNALETSANIEKNTITNHEIQITLDLWTKEEALTEAFNSWLDAYRASVNAEAQAIKDAASAAADADISSTFVYTEGEGTPP